MELRTVTTVQLLSVDQNVPKVCQRVKHIRMMFVDIHAWMEDGRKVCIPEFIEIIELSRQ